MAAGQAIRAGGAFVEIFTDDSRLRRGLNAAAKRLKSWGSSVTSAGKTLMLGGGAVLTPLLGAVKVFADMGGGLADMSARTGMSVEALSELGYAAQMTGADTATLEGALLKMQQKLADAGAGSDSAIDALQALGLSVEDLANLAPDEQFALIGDRLSKIENPAKRTAAAMDVLGKSGAALIPMFADGAAGLDAMRKHAQRLGLTISGEDAAAADELSDALDDLWKTLKMVAFFVGSAVGPDLKSFAVIAARVTADIIRWIKDNKQLIATIFMLAEAVTLAGAALVGLGVVLWSAGTVLGTLSAGLGLIGSLIGAILSPIGLLVSAIVGGVAAWATWTESGRSAVSTIGGLLSDLWDIAQRTFSGIGDALAAGDLELAGRIAFLGLNVAVSKALGALRALVGDTIGGIVGLLASGDLFGAWSLTLKGLASLWANTWAGMVRVFAMVSQQITKMWSRLSTGLAKGLTAVIANDPILSKAFEAYSGVNIQEEQKRGEELRRKEIILKRQRLGEALDRRDTPMDEAATARNEAIIEGLQSDLAALGTPYDFTKRMQEDIGRQGKQWEQDWTKALDDMAREADRNAAEAARTLDTATKDATDSMDESATQAQKDLEEALALAKAERAAREAEDAAKVGKEAGDAIDEAGGGKTGVVGTFSAAAVRGIAGGGPVERMARGIDMVVHNTAELNRWMRTHPRKWPTFGFEEGA